MDVTDVMDAQTPIPQTDPKAGYLAHQSEIDAAIARTLNSGWYILGREVAAFEEAFAAYVGVRYGVGVASGTDALEIALRACEVKPGDAVFTVSHTAVATVAAVERSGATPVLVDIDPATYTMDPNCLEDAVKAAVRPKAVLPVHLYGHPANLPAILDIARRYDLLVVEDCAQAHGAALDGRRLGAWGHIAAFSFYPTKNLAAIGDGGMVLTDDAGLAERARLLRQYGWRERYVSALPGLNSRLDELQAAILGARLPYLDAENARRRALASAYDRALASSGLGLPAVQPGATHVYHQYVVRTARRDALQAHLKARRIGTGVHYPVPVHLQPAYQSRLASRPLPHTEQAAREVLSLPMFPQLTDAQLEIVAGAIQDFAP
mgnify:CR=1 FL=1